ncbi:hypothetical protein CK203_089607 [Vitis vinifera]|uniref:Protein kinase domain-containing protein n=1 Tax=Vitis vinifera TaxID=29760 RepID=A0A438EYP9_VITVI|nr:hypothetical protein CK203_089607 [Vitis vinifera]
MKESSDGFVRADQIDLKSLDEQLEKHLNRVWTMDKNKKKEDDSSSAAAAIPTLAPSTTASTTAPTTARQDWEIDPSKLIIRPSLLVALSALSTVAFTTAKMSPGHRTEAEIASLRAAFTQEVAVWHKLDHPNVTKVACAHEWLFDSFIVGGWT